MVNMKISSSDSFKENCIIGVIYLSRLLSFWRRLYMENRKAINIKPMVNTGFSN